ncbi:precorrin-6A/cobalt-precorrin-6A reductase [Aureimonas sp. OT7]|uniref:precorrin-6A/cobalt-precorrin-6A reductase n=1 Tax=Aureimonas sp. OT7 TaxID=2816454 RepID=UPI00177F7E0C|nr:precorrin-6A/cobalt-precorrin-6A reductase [Aureimonas sp. OT7]QOG06637.1 precorrin-6A/cobalt-precorrin-6A reductase [Aureimonas sp. OT7]
MIAMHNASQTILLIAGTSEARALSEAIARDMPKARLIVSLLGATEKPAAYAGSVRTGGFGGVAGLGDFLRAENVTHLVDAAHPFATGMHRNATAAAARAGVPCLAMIRPEWPPRPNWQEVACLRAASVALPHGAKPFLALGQRHLAPFRHRADLGPVLRMAEGPRTPLPFPAEIVIGPPLRTADEEQALFRRYGVTHLVCRNSGGQAGIAKLDAAEALGLPVLMIRRPAMASNGHATDPQAALDWLRSHSAFRAEADIAVERQG